MDRQVAKAKIAQLVDRFRHNEEDYCRPGSDYNEAQTRSDFIDPLFKALGWDVDNVRSLPQHLREVIHEATLKLDAGGRKKPDYSFRLAGTKKFYVEAKKPSVDIEKDSTSALQIRQYGWSARLPVSVLTNFKHLVIYDCSPVPQQNDDYRVCKLKEYSFDQYVTCFDEIYKALSREHVYSGEFDRIHSKRVVRGTIAVDRYFLEQIREWRLLLAQDILSKNQGINENELNYVVHSFINRIVFLRICEDRDLEKYERLLNNTKSNAHQELLRMFREADKKYDSNIFDFAKDKLSLAIQLSDDILVKIIRDLYYPRSPYVFTEISSQVLGQVYELFLAERIAIEKPRKCKIVEKPEVAQEQGVVPTPPFIIEEIVQRTVNRLIEDKSPGDISALQFVDIACGSGSFLVEAYDCLLRHHLQWYIRADALDKLYEGEGNTWHLRFDEKKRVLVNNIFGVDIDPLAVEVTRFNLLVKLLEDEKDVTLGSIKRSLLPSLDNNTRCGNSVVDSSFYSFKAASQLKPEEIARFNIFDIGTLIRRGAGGFTAIIGNPPYTRIQTMKRIMPVELGFYQIHYKSATSGNIDKYYVFLERGLDLLATDGVLGFIVPHKFMIVKGGAELRSLVTLGKHVREILHFGTEQVFPGKQNYTSILILSKESQDRFYLELVDDLQKWIYDPEGRVLEARDSDEVTDQPWKFIPKALLPIYRKLNSLDTTLGDVAHIHVGLQTSADDILIVRALSETNDSVTFRDTKGVQWTIERSILKPAIKDLQLSPFMTVKANAHMIFPYRFQHGKAVAYTPTEMKQKFPRTYSYLLTHKAALKKRNIQPDESGKWYKFGRSQSLTKFQDGERLIAKVLSREPCFSFDDKSIHFTGGGNGPYYGVSVADNQEISPHFLQGVLNSRIAHYWVRYGSSGFQGKYYSYSKQYLEDLPMVIPDLTNTKQKKEHDNIVKIVKKLIQTESSLARERIATNITRLARLLEALKHELNDAVYELYSLSKSEKSKLRLSDLT